MKSLLFVVSFVAIFCADSSAQKAYYFSSCYMDGDQLTVGRAKVFSNVFKAGTDTDKKQLMDQYWEYLNQEKIDPILKDYFKYKINYWGEAAVKKVEVFGPFSYLQAQQNLRKKMKSTRSRDWLVLKVESFGYYPNKL